MKIQETYGSGSIISCRMHMIVVHGNSEEGLQNMDLNNFTPVLSSPMKCHDRLSQV